MLRGESTSFANTFTAYVGCLESDKQTTSLIYLLQSFVSYKDEVFLDAESFSCDPMESRHEEHVTENKNHQRPKLTVTEAVSKKHKDEESGSDEADAGSKKNQTTPEVCIEVECSCFL